MDAQHGSSTFASVVATTGVVSFGCVNAMSCWMQGAVLGVSTGAMAPIPTLLGMVSITVASVVAHTTAICTQHFCDERRRRRNKSIPEAMRYAWTHRPTIQIPRHNELFTFLESSHRNNQYMHTIRICIVGLVCFKVLGGRFWSIAPSSYTHIGSYARGSIAATDQYATPLQRKAIERLGRIYGCHTCGSKPFFHSAVVNFIGDHQPPKAVSYQMNQRWFRRILGWKVPFRFYPQCAPCSSKQGGILASATVELVKSQSWNRWFSVASRVSTPSLKGAGGGQKAYIHGLRPRLYNLTGGIIALMATIDTNDQGRQRYIKIQSTIETFFQQQYRRHKQLQQAMDKLQTFRPFINAATAASHKQWTR
jgi:hypothetical protein